MEATTKDEPVEMRLLPPQNDLPPGKTWQCSACGARIRANTPHSAVRPFPHHNLDTFGEVVVPPPDERVYLDIPALYAATVR